MFPLFCLLSRRIQRHTQSWLRFEFGTYTVLQGKISPGRYFVATGDYIRMEMWVGRLASPGNTAVVSREIGHFWELGTCKRPTLALNKLLILYKDISCYVWRLCSSLWFLKSVQCKVHVFSAFLYVIFYLQEAIQQLFNMVRHLLRIIISEYVLCRTLVQKAGSVTPLWRWLCLAILSYVNSLIYHLLNSTFIGYLHMCLALFKALGL